jgi:hypothetical protein
VTGEHPTRHLSREGLDEYLLNSAPATITVPGTPMCRVVIDAGGRTMALHTPAGGVVPADPGYEHVAVNLITDAGRRWCEVRIDYYDHPREAYLLLSDICDLLQESKVRFQVAVESALRTFQELLASNRSLGREQEIGLFGELLFLAGCLESVDHAEALDAWKGFGANEHDFVFAAVSFEIKTTSTERRRHRIGSVEQLQPPAESALWLTSIQLTAASAATGRTLTELVDEIRFKTGELTEVFDRLLVQAGWRERDRNTYTERWRLRSTPAAFLVDADFPVLDRAAIEAGCARPELITDASYIIDLTTLTPGAPPHPADSFVGGDDHVAAH